MTRISWSAVLAVMVTALAVQGAAAAPARTPDQQLVTGLKTARAASRVALSSISPASPTGAKKAATELSRAIAGIDAASKAAASAVGALETSSVRTAVRQGPALARQARSDVLGRRYAAAREKLRRVDALTSSALSAFGVPLVKDFPAFVTTRKNVIFTGAPIRCTPKDFCGDHTGLSALVGRDIATVVIGAADRRTANAGESRAVSVKSRGLPITYKGPAFLVEASGQYTTNHCTLKSGLITCRLYSAMPADRVFMIAFGPPLPKGTKLLVKFSSPAGDRSYAVHTTTR
ncbi:MAG TPA: hypothetical protein VFR32_09275 [Gaiellaceae bacterium]|nr:hypothetical protein [Gaiellaceae bacterium]